MNAVFKYGCLLVSVAVVLVQGIKLPVYNWDMIAYVAVANWEDGFRGKELHDRTYQAIRKEVDTGTYEKLTTGGSNNYHEILATDPQALEQLIPLYSTRVVSITAMRAFKWFGISYPEATYLISAITAALAVLALFFLFFESNDLPSVAFPLIILSTGYVGIARLSSSDALTCLLALCTIFLARKKSIFCFVLLGFWPLIRTDYILLSVIISIYAYYRISKPWSILALLIAFLCYFLNQHIHGNYGYLTMWNAFFINGHNAYPQSVQITTDPMPYLRFYLRGAIEFLHNPHFVIYGFMLYFLYVSKSLVLAAKENIIVVSCFGFVFLEMLLLPLYEIRHFVWAASLVAVELLILMKPSTFVGKKL